MQWMTSCNDEDSYILPFLMLFEFIIALALVLVISQLQLVSFWCGQSENEIVNV